MEAFRCDKCKKFFGGGGGCYREVPVDVGGREATVAIRVSLDYVGEDEPSRDAELCPECMAAAAHEAAEVLRREHEVKKSSAGRH